MLGNWVRETTTTTGTGDLTVSSASGYPTFNNVFGTGQYFYYSILDDSTGAPIEIGIGHLSASTTLVRDKVLATYVSSTYDDTAPAAATLAAGTKRVICTPEAAGIGMPPVSPASGLAGNYRRAIGVAGAPTNVASSIAIVKDRLYYVPIYVGTAQNIASIRALWAGTGGTGGTRGVRLGLYGSLPSGGPGTKLIESGDITATAFLELTYTPASSFRLPPGWYYAAMCADYTAGMAMYHAYGHSGPDYPLGVDTSANRIIMCYEALSASWASLPATASTTPTAVAPAGSSNNVPHIYLVLA